jgi:hypothetical protein
MRRSRTNRPLKRRTTSRLIQVIKQGRLLSEFAWERTRVGKVGNNGRIYAQRDGYRLTKDLFYLDRYGRIHFLAKGYVWDGPSYPNFLQWLLGRREKEALLIASAFHDAFSDHYPLLFWGERAAHYISAIKASAYLSADFKAILHRQWMQDAEPVKITIAHGARLYNQMKADHPEPGETISKRRRLRQHLGLLIFQRSARLFTGTGNWIDLDKPPTIVNT